MQAWADRDLKAAQNALLYLDDREQLVAQQAIMGVWMRKDPEAALAAVAQEDRPIFQRFQKKVAGGYLAVHDPERFFTWAETLTDEERMDMVQIMDEEGSVIAHEVRMRFVQEYQNEDWRVAQVIGDWAKQSPYEAAAWISENGGEDTQSHYSALIATWAGWDAGAALQYAKAIETPEHRDMALLRVLTGTTLVDVMEEAYNSIEAPEAKEQATHAMVIMMGQVAPERVAIYERLVTQ